MNRHEPMSYTDMLEQDEGPAWQSCQCGETGRPLCSDARKCPLHDADEDGEE